ncbi:MAG TPA: exosortase family protein XrtF [Flavobacterium sp.]|uniref:exosortase family protein XrtF n=1 Tax=Flavobacterium sp. TaxID=239 RepID=UPI001B69CDB9|nr:exosortase family protein XrtF [Flavobacterium sp.]MBP6146477.1 exosortase family protein XrtF [Flavobacterium sp.]MBP7182663.1 exosortase family protein XrtF [Flavobacterium sp.]MBP7317538.1 exosortase family protein XrtF [Flavobacterium sp.]MBP8886084.1 exosortase family protein XrtF [Flavobacterium sp.]HRL71935.1 exosortase family protein XrtF [Flavobacterium sp.]
MKKYFILYKPFLFFLGAFFLTYIVLTFFYQRYLNGFEENQIDSVTRMVSENTQQVLRFFNDRSSIEESAAHPYMKLFYNEKYVARIVEGCNAVSVIILFISFVVAFSGKLKATLLFIFGGSLLIYVLNVIRIATLSALIYYFPKQESFLHEVLFPLYIYGVVFILWLIWVRKFSRYASKDSE